MAVVPNPPEKKDEIRIWVCKGCGRAIDEVGCIIGCKYDDNYSRHPATTQYRVYVFDRIEPHRKIPNKRG